MLDGFPFPLGIDLETVSLHMESIQDLFVFIPLSIVFVVGRKIFQNKPLHPRAHFLFFVCAYRNRDVIQFFRQLKRVGMQLFRSGNRCVKNIV
jgi:hypothetical protein